MVERQEQPKRAIKKVLAWVVLSMLLFWIGANWPSRHVEKEKKVELTSGGSATETVSPSPKKEPKAEIVAEMINFRAKPEVEEQTIIGTLRRGAVVKVIDNKGEWLLVELDSGAQGYIAYKPTFVRLLDE